MTLYKLLSELSERGVNLWAEGDQLRIRAPQQALTPELRNSLAESKAELLFLLRQNNIVTNNTDLPVVVPCLAQRHEPFPLTDMQHAFWVGRSGILELGNVANHGYYEIECIDLDLERLNQALQGLIERHDMLRAIVLPSGQQVILEQVPFYQIEVLDLREQDDEVVTSVIENIRQRMSHQVLPADQWPVFEFQATRLDEQRIRLHFSYDLQTFDAWSMFRFFDEWYQIYQNPNVGLPPLELSFRDYVLAEQKLQDTELCKRSQEYWFNRLDELPPAPDLPLAKNPKEIKEHQNQRYKGRLEPADWQQLKQRSANAGLTPSGVLLAAFAEILTVWGNPRFTINLALFNRLPLHPQVNDILGDFTSVTLLAVDNSTPEPFSDRSRRLQQQLWQDLEHRYISGVRVTRELARRRGKAPSAMPVVFTSTLGFSSLGQETLTFSHFGELVYGISQASQAWMDIQVWEDKGALTFNWDVVEELFPEGLIVDMFETYCRFLKQLATSELAWTETNRQLIPPVQLAQREVINATTAPTPGELLHTLFAAQVQKQGGEPAVISSERTLNYQELYTLANQVGHRLRQLGVVPNQLIAVVMEKGWEQIVAVMGILAAGAAYVPIDPGLPQQRREYLLENSQVKIVLTQSCLDKKLQWPLGIQLLCIDTEAFANENSQPLQPVQTPDDLAYVIYTSGSTGLPKGVMITHRNVVNVVVHTNQRFHITSQDRILALTALNHDLSVYDIFGLLSAGGAIVMPDARAVKDPAAWAELMVREKVTLWNSVPAMMKMLVEYAENQSVILPTSWRLAILGGDWLPVSLPTRLQTLRPGVQILSIGGPTETTIWNIGYLIAEVNPNWKSIPYGKPMANAKYYILNEALEDCPVWVPGQMYCAGVQVAKGYWQDEEKTAANFIIHPRTKERIYRTGDLGRYLADGNIEFLGRVDFQIKLRGYRIEIGEIEAALKQHPDIKDAIVTAVGESPQNQHLVAYVVPQQDKALSFLETESADSFISQLIWQSLVQAGLQQAQNSFWDADVPTFAAIWEHQNYLYTISVCRALRKLGVYNSPGEKYGVDDLMSRCQIAPRYQKWLNRALQILVKEGWLQQQGEVFTSVIELPITVSQKLAKDIQINHGFTKTWMDLIPDAPFDDLADIITEKIHSAEIYISETTRNIYKIMFADCNAIASEIIATMVQNLEPGKQLRILEVGSGYGSTTEHLLPLLPSSTTYVFTDISQFFLQQAQEKFANYPFVSYDILDLEKNPVEQGFELHSFDFIIAATVIHNTQHVEQTLKNIRSLLAPNGLLLGIEKTQFHPSFDLNMGLQQGFERFEDRELRSEHPVLSKEQWRKILASLEFTDSVFMNQSGSVADLIGFDVFIAQVPATVQRFKPKQLRDFLGEKLPEYMLPAEFVLLDTLPLTANGKVDRRALPGLQGWRSQVKAAYVMPQTETEKVIASIWQEVLRIEKVGINNNFFELGGDSLQVTQVVSRVHEKFQINIPMQSLLQTPTLASLAKSIDEINITTQKLQAPIDKALTNRVEIEL